MSTSQRREPMSRGEFFAFAILAVVVGLLVVRSRESRVAPVLIGTPLPPIMATGWLNTDGPISREDLNGKVVVVDCWATRCPPCRRAMPQLAKLPTILYQVCSPSSFGGIFSHPMCC